MHARPDIHCCHWQNCGDLEQTNSHQKEPRNGLPGCRVSGEVSSCQPDQSDGLHLISPPGTTGGIHTDLDVRARRTGFDPRSGACLPLPPGRTRRVRIRIRRRESECVCVCLCLCFLSSHLISSHLVTYTRALAGVWHTHIHTDKTFHSTP